MKKNQNATPEQLQKLENSAIEFGKTIIAWRKSNNWTQYTISEWSKQIEFGFPSYCNLSYLENGKILHPRPITFIQLGELNLRVAEINQSSLLEIKDIKLRKIIAESKPIETFHCGLWDAQHFFMHFIGILNPPDELRSIPPVPPIAETKEQAFMMLSPRRFQVIGNQIAVPEKMTKKESEIIHFLCKEYEYFPLVEK